MRHLDPFLESLEAAGRRETTRRTYRRAIEQFETTLSIFDPRLVDPRILDTYGFRMSRRGLAANTRRLRLTVVASFLRWCYFRGIISSNPAADLVLPDAEVPRITVLKKEEATSIIFGIPPPTRRQGVALLRDAIFEARMFSYLRDMALLAAMYYLGLRASEPRSLLVEHVDLSSGAVALKGKGRHRFETRHLHDDYLTPLRTFLGFREKIGDRSPLLFPPHVKSQAAAGVSPWYVAWILKARFEKLGFQKGSRRISPHIFRYSLATHLHNGGMPLDEIQVVLRHRDISTTRRYLESVTARSADLKKRRILNRTAIFRRMGEIERAVDRLTP